MLSGEAELHNIKDGSLNVRNFKEGVDAKGTKLWTGLSHSWEFEFLFILNHEVGRKVGSNTQ